MSEETSVDATETETGDGSRKSPPADSYPARDSETGEEQRNRLGYMVTEPTEDEIEESGESDDKKA